MQSQTELDTEPNAQISEEQVFLRSVTKNFWRSCSAEKGGKNEAETSHTWSTPDVLHQVRELQIEPPRQRASVPHNQQPHEICVSHSTVKKNREKNLNHWQVKIQVKQMKSYTQVDTHKKLSFGNKVSFSSWKGLLDIILQGRGISRSFSAESSLRLLHS